MTINDTETISIEFHERKSKAVCVVSKCLGGCFGETPFSIVVVIVAALIIIAATVVVVVVVFPTNCCHSIATYLKIHIHIKFGMEVVGCLYEQVCVCVCVLLG